MLKVYNFQHDALHGSRYDLLLFKHIPHQTVKTINECDLVFCPDITTNDHSRNMEVLHAALSVRGTKPLVVFMPDDPTDILPLLFPGDDRRLLIYRTSLLRTLQAPYERSLPSFMCADAKLLQPCEQTTKPQIGFCGTIRYPSRAQSCVILASDNRFETFFIPRGDAFYHYDHATQVKFKLEFEECMQNYPYQLASRGAGNFSHRMFEVLAAGRIPVLIDTDICLPSNVPQQLWKDCIVMVANVKDLPDALLAFHASHDLVETQLKCRDLWETYLSVPAFAKHLESEMLKLIATPTAQHLRVMEDEKENETEPGLFRAVFGNKDVTSLVPREQSFVVDIKLFGDPMPNVYKFLKIISNGHAIVVGEHDTVENVYDFKVPKSAQMAPLEDYFRNKKGLEIGGASMYSVRPLGVYTLPRSLDNLHLFDPPGPFRLFGKNIPGSTFSGDITDIAEIFPEECYDFVFASHVLEHVKNPLKALVAIRKVVRTRGHVVLILPFKDVTFDHRRPTTFMDELIEHYEQKETEEDVMDHVTPELLDVYDFDRDPEAGGREKFVERCKQNFKNRCLHIHVFDFQLIYNCFQFAGFKPVYSQLVDGHQIVVGRKQ